MSQSYAITEVLRAARRASPLLFWSAIIMFAGMLSSYVLLTVDPRLFNGVSVWEKPAKFALSLGLLMLTVAWAMSLLEKPAAGVVLSARLLVLASAFEIVYVAFRSARGEASHFNTSTPIASAMYAAMGIGAVTLTFASGFVGWRVWQQHSVTQHGQVMRKAAGLGLMLATVLATLTAGYLSSLGSHWIGGDQSDTTGVGFFHWSTTGGDLRVSHFIGLHAMQFLPLAALTGRQSVMWCAAAVCVAATGVTFLMAINGMPLFRA